MAELKSITSLYNDANLQEYWRLEDNTGKNGNGLTNDNSVTFTPAVYGLGGNMGTTNTNKRLWVGNGFGINGGTISLVGWCQILTEITSGTYGLFANIFDQHQVQYYIAYEYNSGTPRVSANRQRVGITTENATFTATLGIGFAHHFALTSDGTSVLNLYLDGKKVSTTALTGGNGNTGNNPATGCGMNFTSSSAGGQNFTPGLFDDFAIFNRILTDAEIMLLYTNPRPGLFFTLL